MSSPTKEALAKIRELKERLAEAESGSREPIAIVSAACRFPKSSNTPEKFWDSLLNEADETSEVPSERWDTEAFFDKNPDAPGKMYTLRGAFLDSIDQMDAEFFGISPREATWVDPQQRLFLEVGWEALERAGWASDGIVKDTGVFVGWMHNDYQNTATDVLRDLNPYIATGSAGSFLCGRLSYYLGVQGPSLAVDTACSSSLVSLHLACQSLRQGECDRALAGGVNVMVSPKTTVMTCKLQALSPTGHSRAFDATADGYLRGEGCGVVALRRLSDAERDGDTILAVIRGSAVTHNGFSGGLTAPNPDSQQRVIRKALEQADRAPTDVTYLEAHGTGTELGDPLEMNAAAAVLGEGRNPETPLLVGSVKTNLGHLEAAAGIAGVIKAVLAIQHGKIPAHLHFETPNPHIAWDRMPVEVVTKQRDWPGDGPRTVGVSAFGMSGTNAHLVIESPPARPTPATENVPETSTETSLLMLSGKNEGAVRSLADRYRTFLTENPDVDLADLAYSAATTRRHFESRAAFVADSREKADTLLATLASGAESPEIFQGASRPDPVVAWQFTGQGSQYLGMGKSLYETEPVFREWMDRFTDELALYRRGNLCEIIFENEALLATTTWTQPALFSIHLALAELLKSWGLKPDFVLGHSLGQYAAACVAGMLSWKDGIRLIHERSRLTGQLPAGGTMGAVFAKSDLVLPVLETHPGLSIAAHNGSHLVISGPANPVKAALAQFSKNEIRTKELHTSHAFHSALLDPILDEFEEIAGRIRFQPARIPLVCNVTGKVLPPDFVPDGAYWRKQLREGVSYEASIRNLSAERCDTILEIGPHPVLTGMAATCWEGDASALIGTLQRDRDDSDSLRETVGKLYRQGIVPDLEKILNQKKNRRKVLLPTYPFQRQYFWGPERPGARLIEEGNQHPLLGGEQSLAGIAQELRFENKASPDSQRWLADHRVFDDILFPGAGYVEMMVAATKGAVTLENISFEMPLMVPETVSMQTVVHQDQDHNSLEIYSKQGGHWIRNVSGKISKDAFTPRSVSLSEIERSCPEVADPKEFYEMFASLGIQYGPEFQTIQSLRYNESEVLAQLELKGEHHGFYLPPMLLDGAFQSLAIGILRDPDSPLFLPVGIDRYQTSPAPVSLDKLWVHGRWNETEGDQRSADLTLFDDLGNVVVHLEKLNVRAVSRSGLRQMVGSSTERLLYTVDWRQKDIPPPLKKEPARWIVAGEPEHWTSQIADGLEQSGQEVTTVILTDQAREPHFWRPYLLEKVDGVVWNTGKPGRDLESYTRRHGAGILSLLRAIREQKIEGLSRGLQIVTSHAHPILEDDIVEPETSQFWGLGRVVGNENPTLQCRLIDCPPNDGPALTRMLLTEAGENQVSIRNGQSYVPRLIPAKAPALNDGLPVSHEGTYLITGGLGMLGRRAAEWLAERKAGHIVLVSRREPTDSTKEIIAEIEKSGCQVHVMLGDTGDRNSLEILLKKVRANLPPLRGILHAAGVLEDGLLVDQTWEKFEKVLAPKKRGAALLHELTRDTPLDFFVLYSSAASVLGSPGQANYAMGNAYLDGLAHHRVAAGLPATSVNFGPWNEGMAATEKVKKAADMQGLTPLTAEEAHEAMDRMIDNHLVQATMLDADWGQMRSRFPVDPPPLLEELWPDAVQSNAGDAVLFEKLREAEENETSREDIFREHVESELQQVLSLTQAPPGDVPLAEMGMDSLMAVEFATRLQRQVGSAFAIPPTLAFDYPTVTKVTDFLAGLVSSIPIVGEKVARPVVVTQDVESIAVVGVGCRFPGAEGADAYWDLLKNGVDATREIPGDRWDMDRYYSPDPAPGKMYTKRGGFLPGIGEFDAELFGLSREDAMWMDPQHRMLLETSWEALEDAGMIPNQPVDPQVGVFMGVMSTDYAQLREQISPEKILGSQGAGLSHSAGVGRINYMFGFQGPCLAIDTASSSSLVAVCQAVRSLLDGECNLALAGGANAILSPINSLLLCKGKVLSPDGRCKSFSASADGFGRGEGCGVVVLKRRSDAERDGDNILALIRGTGISHNGQNAGLTAPSGPAQEQMIQRALQNARIEPEEVQYLEAHASGTEMGDAIEVNAAARVLGGKRNGKNPLLMGSAKANLSHLEAAGGIAGLIKVVLSLKHGVIPPQIQFDKPSAHIPWDKIPAKVVPQAMPWPEADRRIAGISSLGMTGTNAHVVLEGIAHQESQSVAGPQNQQLLVISATSAKALAELSDRYIDKLRNTSEADFAAFCELSLFGRSHHEHRLAVMARSPNEAITLLHTNRKPVGEILSTVDAGELDPDLVSLGQDYLAGKDIERNSSAPRLDKKNIKLPTYPFQRKRYWLFDKP